jgi:hypothetical protein
MDERERERGSLHAEPSRPIAEAHIAGLGELGEPLLQFGHVHVSFQLLMQVSFSFQLECQCQFVFGV